MPVNVDDIVTLCGLERGPGRWCDHASATVSPALPGELTGYLHDDRRRLCLKYGGRQHQDRSGTADASNQAVVELRVQRHQEREHFRFNALSANCQNDAAFTERSTHLPVDQQFSSCRRGVGQGHGGRCGIRVVSDNTVVSYSSRFERRDRRAFSRSRLGKIDPMTPSR